MKEVLSSLFSDEETEAGGWWTAALTIHVGLLLQGQCCGVKLPVDLEGAALPTWPTPGKILENSVHHLCNFSVKSFQNKLIFKQKILNIVALKLFTCNKQDKIVFKILLFYFYTF